MHSTHQTLRLYTASAGATTPYLPNLHPHIRSKKLQHNMRSWCTAILDSTYLKASVRIANTQIVWHHTLKERES